MLSLIFGLIAAFAWAVHDLLVRKISQNLAIVPMMLVVLVAGVVALTLPAVTLGLWSNMTASAYGLAVMSGAVYAIGMGGLYFAFSAAPVRLVAPILGSIPVLSLAIAAFEGKAVTMPEVMAVLAIVGGIVFVAVTVEEGDEARHPRLAILAAVAGATGFAFTYWFGQLAVRQGDPLPVILVARIATLGVLLAVAILAKLPISLGQANGSATTKLLIGMGVLDAMALGLVTASGGLPNPEYAAISSSLFGVLTIVLAFWFLKERVTGWQWLGILTVFAGVGVLSAQG